MANHSGRGMGWLRDQPDIRDYWIEIGKPASRQTKKTSSKKGRLSGKSELKLETTPSPTLSSVADSVGKLKFPYPPPAKHLANVKWCSPVEDQGALGSCTAQAGVGLFEYYQRRFSGTHVDGSRRFVYKATRNLLGWTGDTGAYCRTTMATIALLGVALEDYWPYTVADPDFDEEPPAFVYALAENYKGLIYHRIDAMGASLPTLTRIKILISVGWPAMFGFTCYESLFDSPVGQTGEIPWPVSGERRVGGHAVVAVGYDDNKKITNNRIGGVETTGAFLIRNSWGTNWGVIPPSAPAGTSRGYGWLPYKYLEQGQATDWWSLTKAEWIPTEGFSL